MSLAFDIGCTHCGRRKDNYAEIENAKGWGFLSSTSVRAVPTDPWFPFGTFQSPLPSSSTSWLTNSPTATTPSERDRTIIPLQLDSNIVQGIEDNQYVIGNRGGLNKFFEWSCRADEILIRGISRLKSSVCSVVDALYYSDPVLKIMESPLESGKSRVRWQCVSLPWKNRQYS